MKKRFSVLFLAIFLLFAFAHGQDKPYALYIVGNTNLYLPGNSSGKGMYPILGYNKNTDPKVLVGGFGLGVSVLRTISTKTILVGEGNISRHSYWNEPLTLTDPSGNFLESLSYSSSDLSVGLNAVFHYSFTKKLSIGAGLGGQFLLGSWTKFPEIDGSNSKTTSNHFYKPVMPVIPIEVTFRSKKNLFTIRYEKGLLNRYKDPFSRFWEENFGLLYFEFGFLL